MQFYTGSPFLFSVFKHCPIAKLPLNLSKFGQYYVWTRDVTPEVKIQTELGKGSVFLLRGGVLLSNS